MNLQEHDNNKFTKERTDIEKYLMRIIQRYFDIENNYTQASIEAIIVESLTRLKRELLDEKGFLFSVNEQTGHIAFSIEDFGGEPTFEKNTAFNKEFDNTPSNTDGYEGTPDTVCMGNDPRLYNKRSPLEHTHIIANINELAETLKDIEIFGQTKYHIHSNSDVINMLEYSKEIAELDLIIIDQLEVRFNNRINNLIGKKTEVLSNKNVIDEALEYKKHSISDKINEAELTVKNSIQWLNDARKYIKNNISNFKANQMRALYDYLLKSEYNNFYEYLKNTYKLTATKIVNIDTPAITYSKKLAGSIPIKNFIESNNLNDVFNTYTRLGHDRWNLEDNTLIFEEQAEHLACLISTKKYETYTHRVKLTSNDIANNSIGVVLAYNAEENYILIASYSFSADKLKGDTYCKNLHLTIRHGIITDNTNANSSLTTIYSAKFGGYLQSSWSHIGEQGVTLLIKKEYDTFTIWNEASYYTTYNPALQSDGTIGIEPIYSPMATINISDIPELAHKPLSYGYCVYSQPFAAFKEIWFSGTDGSIIPLYNTYKKEHSTIGINVDIDNFSPENNIIELNFICDKFKSKLPFIYSDEYGQQTIIQGFIDYNNKSINIKTNKITTLPFEYTEANYYDEHTIIAPVNKARTITETKEYLELQHCNLCLIDSQDKQDFINPFLFTGLEYFIQGNQIINETKDDEGNNMEYTNWADGYPNLNDRDKVPIYIDSDRKWKTLYLWGNEGKCCIAEYKFLSFLEYFKNPKVEIKIYKKQ